MGTGRPGWHVECSAMSTAYLGYSFDIHGAGMDLLFPPHENEIAQSCAACKQSYISYWIHNGFVTIDSEKMFKSLWKFFTIRQNIDKFPLVKYPVLVIHGYVNNLMQGRSYSSQWRSLCKLFSSIGSIQCLVIDSVNFHFSIGVETSIGFGSLYITFWLWYNRKARSFLIQELYVPPWMRNQKRFLEFTSVVLVSDGHRSES